MKGFHLVVLLAAGPGIRDTQVFIRNSLCCFSYSFWWSLTPVPKRWFQMRTVWFQDVHQSSRTKAFHKRPVETVTTSCLHQKCPLMYAVCTYCDWGFDVVIVLIIFMVSPWKYWTKFWINFTLMGAHVVSVKVHPPLHTARLLLAEELIFSCVRLCLGPDHVFVNSSRFFFWTFTLQIRCLVFFVVKLHAHVP